MRAISVPEGGHSLPTRFTFQSSLKTRGQQVPTLPVTQIWDTERDGALVTNGKRQPENRQPAFQQVGSPTCTHHHSVGWALVAHAFQAAFGHGTRGQQVPTLPITRIWDTERDGAWVTNGKDSLKTDNPRSNRSAAQPAPIIIPVGWALVAHAFQAAFGRRTRGQ